MIHMMLLNRLYSDMTTAEKWEQTMLIILKFVILALIIFVFISALSMMADAFRLVGGRGLGRRSERSTYAHVAASSGNTIKNSRFLQNPISASIIGCLNIQS